MPHIPVLPPESASGDVLAVYENFGTRMSFPKVPNFIATQGHSPTVVRGTWDLVRNVLVEGEIPRWKKEMIFVAISSDRNCGYCTAAHLACCRMLGVTASALVKDVKRITDTALREMILFALKCARDPQSLVAEDYDRLAKLGFSRSQIVEVIAMSGLAVYANIMADATAMEPDKMFTLV
jgi:uncharacterized peroxidase-related enzyme